MKAVKMLSHLLVLIGGLNWGLVGFFKFDLVSAIFGDMSSVSRIVYSLVGLGALVMVFTFKCDCGGKCPVCKMKNKGNCSSSCPTEPHSHEEDSQQM